MWVCFKFLLNCRCMKGMYLRSKESRGRGRDRRVSMVV